MLNTLTCCYHKTDIHEKRKKTIAFWTPPPPPPPRNKRVSLCVNQETKILYIYFCIASCCRTPSERCERPPLIVAVLLASECKAEVDILVSPVFSMCSEFNSWWHQVTWQLSSWWLELAVLLVNCCAPTSRKYTALFIQGHKMSTYKYIGGEFLWSEFHSTYFFIFFPPVNTVNSGASGCYKSVRLIKYTVGHMHYVPTGIVIHPFVPFMF